MTVTTSIDPRIAARVTPRLVDAFQRDGAVCIRQLLSPDEVGLLREGGSAVSLHRVQCDQVAPTPWRNGAGLTRDLLHWPGAADWQVRISVADIGVDSPFSSFADAERWFAVLEGHGVRLHLPGGLQSVVVDGPALHFRGEDAPACELIDGPTRDLNLMCRRGLGHADMRRADVGVAFDDTASLRALFSADALTLFTDTGETAVAAFTLVWAEGATRPWRIGSTLHQPRAWWMSFDPVHQP